MTQTSGQRGRPRDPSIDGSIQRATLQLFATGGYGRVTIEEIADLAGVSRPTVYRRYSGKDEAIRDALRTVHTEFPDPVFSGDLRADLLAVLRELDLVTRQRAAMGLVGAVLIEESRHPDLIQSFREGVVWPRRRMVAALLEMARDAGAVRDDVDLDAVTDLLIGSWYAAYTTLPAMAARWPESIIETLLTLLSCGNGK